MWIYRYELSFFNGGSNLEVRFRELSEFKNATRVACLQPKF